MNYHSAVLVTVSALIAVGALRFMYRHVCVLNAATASDIYPFLLKIDMEWIYGTFRPDAEKHFRENLPKNDYSSSASTLQLIIAINSRIMSGFFSLGQIFRRVSLTETEDT